MASVSDVVCGEVSEVISEPVVCVPSVTPVVDDSSLPLLDDISPIPREEVDSGTKLLELSDCESVTLLVVSVADVEGRDVEIPIEVRIPAVLDDAVFVSSGVETIEGVGVLGQTISETPKYFDGSVQERRNSSALEMELRLGWTSLSIYT